ncbi:YjeF-related protein [Desulfotomaculum nigrificans CO-1-SRB]|uniref:Bifunctional NAD(P)H-hydrate repair enzyme n=1 Tax=Desulfotomaculum nigrificans (strain DSM 14880 / VKM B-2319 / CO-1-SRB) TaxID=868595 RepID=F6B7D1_DESCC|nr:bifunctional ADP-dependent NAD(P)H-hydrate dehydratase/NAD(P)H-hydrate epimerase [Desulfotomaculum nigrificans]AEF93381.1 YjeF-related protein [Desulfotomaculum nigrificans CO-1-SRB]
MRVVTAAEMRQIDQTAIKQHGIPGIVLMENAGLRVVEVIEGILGDVRDQVFSIIVGKGNNGGDGLVVARHLLNRGAQVKVLLMADPADFQGDARVNLNIWQNMGQPVYQVNQVNGINIIKVALLNTSMVIDALYGTGFHGVVNEKVGRIIELINDSHIPVVAVDIPSGLEADTGQVNGPCIKADHTVTFGLPKIGLVVEPGASYTGQLHIVDISLPRALTEAGHLQKYLLTGETVARWLPPRQSTGHKGTYGRVLVVAGSRGMVGAARLTTRGTLRAGAGLVTLALPAGLQPVAAASLDEAMSLALPETPEGTLAIGAAGVILETCRQVDVLALGPGLSTHPETAAMVKSLLPELEVPTVLDADALNALVGDVDMLGEAKAPLIITPHPGEMARLLDLQVAEVQENRIDLALAAARKWRVVVVLKGARTIVASPNGNIYINPTGNPGMATGGSGDALTGIIAGLLGQGLNPEQAAAAGVYLHGRAGDLAAEQLGQVSLLAGDIISFLPDVFKELENSFVPVR